MNKINRYVPLKAFAIFCMIIITTPHHTRTLTTHVILVEHTVIANQWVLSNIPIMNNRGSTKRTLFIWASVNSNSFKSISNNLWKYCHVLPSKYNNFKLFLTISWCLGCSIVHKSGDHTSSGPTPYMIILGSITITLRTSSPVNLNVFCSQPRRLSMIFTSLFNQNLKKQTLYKASNSAAMICNVDWWVRVYKKLVDHNWIIGKKESFV